MARKRITYAGDARMAMLEDIAVLTNGKCITEDLGIRLEDVKIGDLGRARKIVSDKESTTLVEGAMHATKATVEEGMVPGGGVALVRAIPSLDALLKKQKDQDMGIGIRIVKRALEEPLRQIANNAGFEGSVIVNQVKDLEKDKGFDAQNEKFVNMIQAGIIDPTKVVRSALQNASSIAALMLTTEAVVNEVPESEKRGLGADMGMGEDY